MPSNINRFYKCYGNSIRECICGLWINAKQMRNTMLFLETTLRNRVRRNKWRHGLAPEVNTNFGTNTIIIKESIDRLHQLIIPSTVCLQARNQHSKRLLNIRMKFGLTLKSLRNQSLKIYKFVISNHWYSFYLVPIYVVRSNTDWTILNPIPIIAPYTIFEKKVKIRALRVNNFINDQYVHN